MSKPTIRDLRERKGMEISTLAALAHISPATIYRMENGIPVGAVAANKVCNVLEVRPDDVNVKILPPLSERRKALKK